MTNLLKKENVFYSILAIVFLIALGWSVYAEQYIVLGLVIGSLFFYWGWQNPKHVFFFLLLTIPFSIEYYFPGGLSTDLPDELLMVLTGGLAIGLCISQKGIFSKQVIRHPLFFLLFVLFGWTLVAVIFSTQLFFSIKFIVAKTWYIAAFVIMPLLLFKEKENVRIAAICFSLSMVAVALVILIRHFPYQFRFADINAAAAPFFRNHVNYSALLVCVIPILVALFSGSKSKAIKYFLLCALLICLVALFFSYARGAWVALIVGIFACWLMQKGLLFKSYLLTLLLAMTALFWLKNNDRYLKYANDYQTTIFHKDFREHLVATYELKDVSTAERFYRWIAGVRMIKDNWLTGYGPNSFYYHYKGYAVPAFKTWVSDNKERSTVHNYFLLTAIEQGIPGLILLLILFGALLWYAQHLYKKAADSFYRITAMTIGVIITMVLVLNFLSDLIETDKLGSVFFLCMGTLIMVDVNSAAARLKRSNASSHI